MDDNALAESCVLFFAGRDHGQCAKCSNLLPKKAKLDSLQARRLIAKALINNCYGNHHADVAGDKKGST